MQLPLDQNFPEPILAALEPWMADIQLVPSRTIDPHLADTLGVSQGIGLQMSVGTIMSPGLESGPRTLSYPPRFRGGSECCGRWVSGCCFGCGAFSAGPSGGGPDTFSVG